MKREYAVAVNLLSTLKRGDMVEFIDGSKTYTMAVTREIHRSDGQFGSYESSRVTVSYGPGRYSRDLTADQMVHGFLDVVSVKRGEQQIFGP